MNILHDSGDLIFNRKVGSLQWSLAKIISTVGILKCLKVLFPSSIGYSSPFVSLFPIAVSISLQDSMANLPPDPRFNCFPRMLSGVCKPCISEEVKMRAFAFLHLVLVWQPFKLNNNLFPLSFP